MERLTVSQPAEEPIRRPHLKHWIKFCMAVANGEAQVPAYRKYVSKRATPASAAGLASRIACHFGAYIASLRRRIADQIEHHSIASKVELLQWHTRAIRTPAELAATADSDLATVTVTTTPDGPVTKIQGPSKADHAQAIAKLAGFDAPQQVQVEHIITDSPALRMIARLKQGNEQKLSIEPVKALDCRVESIDPAKDCARSIPAQPTPAILEATWIKVGEDDVE